jgi:hypothetical protein
MIGCVDDDGVFKFSEFIESLKDTTDLLIDVFAAGHFAAQFVANAGFIAILPDTADSDLIANISVGVVEWMSGEIVGRQSGLEWIEGRKGVGIAVVDCSVLPEQFRDAVACVMRV